MSGQDLADESLAIASSYGIREPDADSPKIVMEIIQQCLTDYCENTPGCSKAGGSSRDSSVPVSICNEETCYNHTNVCQGVYAPVIDDIAGIGIYTSYWMQNGIALSAFGLLRFFDFWIYYVTIALFSCASGRKGARRKGESARQMGLRYRVPNLISALFEFQKAQCFFMIAVQVAAIIIVQRGGFEAKYLQQLSNSFSATTLVAICGYLPVVFTLLNLHGAGKCSWYILTLSTITIVISGVTAFNTRKFYPSPNDMADLRGITGNWTSCGNKNPTTFCLSPRTVDPFNYPGGAKHIFIFCLIVLIFLIIDKARTSPLFPAVRATTTNHNSLKSIRSFPLGRRTMTQLSALSGLSSVPSYYGRLDVKTKRAFSNLLYGCLWIVFLFFYCRAVYLLSTWINNQSGVIGPCTWSFGQIVGITVWVPSLIQYLYLETRGMIAWFDQHVAGDHKVVEEHNNGGPSP